jgi:hypothetical protein
MYVFYLVNRLVDFERGIENLGEIQRRQQLPAAAPLQQPGRHNPGPKPDSRSLRPRS